MRQANEEIGIYNYLIIAAAVVLSAAVFWARWQNQDLYFAQGVFTKLTKGDPAAIGDIDWPNFKAIGADVGAEYNRLPNDRERADYQKTFVKNFSRGFQFAGAKINLYKNWRVDYREAKVTAVAVEDTVHRKTALFIITKDPKHKLAGLAWKE